MFDEQSSDNRVTGLSVVCSVKLGSFDNCSLFIVRCSLLQYFVITEVTFILGVKLGSFDNCLLFPSTLLRAGIVCCSLIRWVILPPCKLGSFDIFCSIIDSGYLMLGVSWAKLGSFENCL